MKERVLTALIFIIFIFPMVIHGQELCDDCALRIVEDVKHNTCCNKCLVEYYTSRLKQDNMHGNLLADDVYTKTEVAQMPKISESISGNFTVNSIQKRIGYYLDDNDTIHRCDFFLCFLKSEADTSIMLSSIVLITADDEQFLKDKSYKLTLHPYFKRDQGIRVINGKALEVVHGPESLFDLVYKKWLVCKLEYGINYFFND